MTREPSYGALKAQNQGLREELDATRRLLDPEQRETLHLWLIWRLEGLRQRARAEAFERQLAAAGLSPVEVEVPEPESAKERSWVAQIEAIRQARRSA